MHFTTAALAAASSVTIAAAACPYAGRFAAVVPQVIRQANDESLQARAIEGKKGIFYLNRIGLSGSQLWTANADGSNASLLLGNDTAAFDYHPSWSSDGNWIVFTSERRGYGQSDLYRVPTNGSRSVEPLVQTDSVDDSGVLSPDGTKLAYVSTYGNYTSNIWLKDLTTGVTRNLTDTDSTRCDNTWPSGHYRPSWSPNGEWIAFSSDRNTDWTGHTNGTGWEHTQSLGLYIVRPSGEDFRQVVRQTDYSLATPQWSADGSRLIYTNITAENTYGAHGVAAQQAYVYSSTYSVDIATGADFVEHSTGVLHVSPQIISNSSNVGYLIKAGDNEGISYTIPDATHKPFNLTGLRNPSWSPDGSQVVYEVDNWEQQPAGLKLWSFDDDWEYRYTDVFPQHNQVVNRLATTQKVLGPAVGSLVTSNAMYENVVTALDSYSIYSEDNSSLLLSGLAGAFQPSWSPDGTELLAGFGGWFTERVELPASIWRVAENGSWQYNLTTQNSNLNAGFPSWSPDGTAYVYRLWEVDTGVPLGLRIFNFTTGVTTNLTHGWDNTPGWSPDGEHIVFTRNGNWTPSYGARWYEDRFDIFTIRPDGTDLNRITDSLSNDAHAVWTADGRILWSSGMYGFKDESHLQDYTFQPYGQILIMDKDGSNKKPLVDTLWEDSMPLYIQNAFL